MKKASARAVCNVLFPVTNSPGKYVFHCPGCETTHMISTNPSKHSSFHTLTGTLDSPTIRASVLSLGDIRKSRPHCHSYITDGYIEFLDDSTHKLAGQKVLLSDYLDS